MTYQDLVYFFFREPAMDFNCETVSDIICIHITFVQNINVFRRFFQEWRDFARTTRAEKRFIKKHGRAFSNQDSSVQSRENSPFILTKYVE